MQSLRSSTIRAGHLWPLLLFGLFLCHCSSENRHPADRAYAKRISEYNECMEGADAYGMPDDFMLYNSEIQAIITDVNYSPGFGLSGGTLVDADIIRKGRDATGRDQFQESIPTVNLLIPEVDDPSVARVSIAKDGSDGGPAIVRVEGTAIPLFTLFAFEGIVGGFHTYEFTTDYILDPGVRYIRMVTIVTMRGDGSDQVAPIPDTSDPLDVFAHIILGNQVLGDVLLFGSSLNVFGPPFGFGEDILVRDLFLNGTSTFTQPILADFLIGVGDKVSYGFATRDGQLSVPLFSASTTAVVGAVSRHEDRFSFERYFVVGEGDVASVLDSIYEIRGTKTGKLEGHLLDEMTMDPVSGASVLVFKVPEGEALDGRIPTLQELEANLMEASVGNPLYQKWSQSFISQFGTDAGEDTLFDGSFSGSLEPGRYIICAHAHDRADPLPVLVTVEDGHTTEQTLLIPPAGRIVFELRDATTHEGIPGKLTLKGVGGHAIPSPVLGDGFLPEGISYVAHTHDGKGEIVVEPGTYDYTFSRGIEYSIDTGRVTVGPRFPAKIYGFIRQVVDSAGYMSMDFHQHCEVSVDSGIPIKKRLITNLAEGVEILTATDHDVIVNYTPIVRDLGAQGLIHPILSEELTTFEMGHYIGFPLKQDLTKPGNGAIDWRGMVPQQIFDAFRAKGSLGRSNTVCHVAHPRDSILGYYYVYSLDPVTGAPSGTGSFMSIFNPLVVDDNYSQDYESTEVLNAKRLEIIRTPTALEYDRMRATGEEDKGLYPECPQCEPGIDGCPLWDTDPTFASCRVSVYRIMKRTLVEESLIQDGTNPLSTDFIHVLDDYFRDLNQGTIRAATAGSDSHSAVRTEAGCPRSYLMFSTDKPGLATDEEIVERIFSQQVFNTYGPFVEVDVDGHPLGSVHTDTDGSVGLHIRIQSPLWFDVARIEIYANGELVREIDNAFGSLEPGEHLDNSRIVNYDHRIELDGLDEDTWFVVLVMGPDNLSPVFTANEFPYIQIGNLISMALSSESFEAIIGDILAECDEQGLHKTWWSLIICLIFEAIGEMENPSEIIEDLLAGLLPKSPSSIFPIHPYAQTNAIFVDVDGNGGYDPPLLAFDRSDGTPGGDEALNPLAQYMSNPAVLKRMARIFASMPQQSTYRIR